MTPGSKSEQNEATATLQNYRYEAAQSPVKLDTTDFMHTIDLNWKPRSVVDKKARVYDSKMGFLGRVVAPGPHHFEYSLLVRPGEHGAPLCGKATSRTRPL